MTRRCVCSCGKSAECSFSDAPETFANHSVSTGSVSLSELSFCCLDWLDPLSVQQSRKCFLPCRTLLFSLFPGSLYSSCVLFVIFPFLLYRRHTVLCKPDSLVGSQDISFSVWSGPFSLHFAHVNRSLQASLWCPCFLKFEAFQGPRIHCSTLSWQ